MACYVPTQRFGFSSAITRNMKLRTWLAMSLRTLFKLPLRNTSLTGYKIGKIVLSRDRQIARRLFYAFNRAGQIRFVGKGFFVGYNGHVGDADEA